jgi:hypothetical protein
MANKNKRTKKQPAKKQAAKKQAPSQVSKKVAEVKAKSPQKVSTAVKPVSSTAHSKNSRPFFVAAGLVVAALAVAFITGFSSQTTQVKDISSHSGEPSSVKVIGTDSDISNLSGKLPSTNAAETLQAPGVKGTTQAVPQDVQPGSPASNLQAPATPSANGLNVN